MKKAVWGVVFFGSFLMAEPIKVYDKVTDEQYPVATQPYENILTQQEQNRASSPLPSCEVSQERTNYSPIRTSNRSGNFSSSSLGPDVSSADSLPLGSEMTRAQIDHVARTCQGKVDEMWEKRDQIPQGRRSSFQQAIGKAQQACKRIQDVNQRLKQADQDVVSFDENMHIAQAQYE